MKTFIAAAAALAAIAGPVAAQSGGKANPGLNDIESMHDFARCVVERSRPGAERVLSQDRTEESYQDDIGRLAKGNEQCLGSTMRISGVLFAGSLAESLLRKDFDPSGLAGKLRAPETPIVPLDDTEFTGLCMALTYPEQTAQLLFADPVSKQADEALTAYAGLLPSCVREGQQMRLNKIGLRALIALSAWRVARATAEPA